MVHLAVLKGGEGGREGGKEGGRTRKWGYELTDRKGKRRREERERGREGGREGGRGLTCMLVKASQNLIVSGPTFAPSLMIDTSSPS